jgi:uncharacterized Zn finger protein
MHQSKTWWGQRFIEALSKFTDSGRLSRGKAYSSDRRILEWEIKSGKIKAKVRGNTNPYFGVYKEPHYCTKLSMSQIPTSEWKALIKLMSTRSDIISRLMLDEMPDTIEELFASSGFNLLPKNEQDFNVSCSCPDYSSPCKHIAGVCYRLAAILDHNPLLLFELRGLSFEKLNKELSNYPLGKALSTAIKAESKPPPLVDSYYTRPVSVKLPETITMDDFWYGKNTFPKSIDPVSPTAIPGIVVKKGGDYPEFWHKATPFTEVMSEFYERMRKGSGLK